MGPTGFYLVTCILLASLLQGCFAIRSSSGGGEVSFTLPRNINASDVVVPEGYAIEAVATGLTFPTGVAFDDGGGVYVVEAGYSYGEVVTVPRLIRIEPGNEPRVVAQGGKNGPWTGATFYHGLFYIAEGGEFEGGRILRVTPDGRISVLIEGLPTRGDHHTNGPAVGNDGSVYFGVGTATNSAIVGEDNLKFGWLKRFPDFHDVPCRDVRASGKNFKTKNFLNPKGEDVETGPYSPLGSKRERNEVIKGNIPCSGAIVKIGPNGGTPELVAWGFRNPFGLAFSSDGTLYVTDNSYDERGSRPVFGTGDLLWKVEEGKWYGWPDYHGFQRLDAGDRYKPQFGDVPTPVLAEQPNIPPEPVVIFPVHSSSDGFDFSRSPTFGFVGQAFVAQLGDESPTTGKSLAPVGFKVVRVDLERKVVEEFAVNKGKKNGPASYLGIGGLERPVAARFDPPGTSLYVVDFGVLLHDHKGAKPKEKTGVLWRIYRKGETR